MAVIFFNTIGNKASRVRNMTRINRSARRANAVRLFGALAIGITLAGGAVAPASAAVRVTVNDSTISDAQVADRAKLLQLEGKKGNSSANAQKELIDEAIKLQEAKRLGVTITDEQVNDAITAVARNLKLSGDKLQQVLSANGVSINTLRDRLRATLAWNAVTEREVSKRVQISEADLEKEAAGKVTKANSYDYVLKEVIFVSGSGSASARTGQANSYRSAFKGCDAAVQLSTKYTDAAVVNIGRRHATQLPEAISKELAGLNIGGITKPRVTENGVSMYAVCSKDEARDLTFITAGLRQEAGSEQLSKEADTYLAELRKKARISR